MSSTEQLRALPSVDAMLQNPKITPLCQRHSSAVVTTWVREAIDDCRRRLIAGDSISPLSVGEFVLAGVIQQSERDRGKSVQRVINATGIILHTNLGRSPLPPAAIDRLSQATGYASVELNLESGRRSQRGSRCHSLISELCGAEDALVVNNCAAATMLVLQALAAGRQAIVSRGQLVEIGGGFRLPDVFRASGAMLCEVGTTNRTYLRDYESAINDQTAVIMRVHRSNFTQTGFVAEPSIDELVSIPRPPDLPVIDDLGSGHVEELPGAGMGEPTVKASVRSGADLTLFSGDKLYGGPQAGIIVGRRVWIDRLRKSPMMRAMRADKLTLAALEATTEIHLSGEAPTQIPVLKMIAAPSDLVRQRCEEAVAKIGNDPRIEIVSSASQVGGGSVPGTTMASFALQIEIAHVDSLARRLRCGTPAIQGRISEDSLVLDFRTVADDEVATVADRLSEALDWLDRQA